MIKRLKLRLIVVALVLTGCATHSKVAVVSPQGLQDATLRQCLDAIIRVTPPPQDEFEAALDRQERLDLITSLDEALEGNYPVGTVTTKRMSDFLRKQLTNESNK